MTKRAHIESQRILPMGETGLQSIHNLLAGHHVTKVNECFIDAFTASAIVLIYNALNDTNKTKLLTLPVVKVADICFSVINKRAA